MGRYITQAIFTFLIASGGALLVWFLIGDPGFRNEVINYLPLVVIEYFILGLLLGSIGGIIAALIDRFFPSNFMKKYGGALFGFLPVAVLSVLKNNIYYLNLWS